MTSPTSCDHRKKFNGDRDLFTKTTFNHRAIDEKRPCIICNVIYPFWKRHRDSPGQHAGYDTSGQPRIQPPHAKVRDKYEIILFEDELGEAYHVLLCFFCLHWHAGEKIKQSFKPKIYTTKEKGNSDIEHLFSWYNAPLRHEQVDRIDDETKERLRTGYDARKLATEVITSAFEWCHAVTDRTNSDPLPSLLKQDTIFEVFRASLDHPYGFLEEEDGSKERLRPYLEYLRPSYSAKYWLNRYLHVTQQRKLPKGKDVTNIAVIHCRLHAARNVGRCMDDELLQYIAKAIQRANYRANYTNGARFSHVLLYGDFVEAEGRRMKELVATAFGNAVHEETFGLDTKDTGVIEVIYISRPWAPRGKETDGEDKEEKNPQVTKLWEKFRDSDFDPVPLQVKILAIWTMLCKRYGPKICVVGHRSGFIEGAALIGILVFYFNCERPPGHEKEGSILCTPIKQNDNSKRLHKLANFMNTLIPLEVFREQKLEVVSARQPSSKLQKISRKVRSLVDTKKYQENPRSKRSQQPGSVEQGSKAQKIEKYKFDNRYKDELMPALFMYMCCTLNSWWTGQPHIPGWIARVAMMHDTISSPKAASVVLGFLKDESLLKDQPEAVRKAIANFKQQLPERDQLAQIRLFETKWNSLSQQTGQKWLWRRFEFARGLGVSGTFEYGWLFQEYTTARRQISD